MSEVGLMRAWAALGFAAFAAGRFGDRWSALSGAWSSRHGSETNGSLVSARRAVITCDFNGPTPG